MTEDITTATKAMMAVVALAASVLCWWTAWVLLTGGSIPITGWEVDGSLPAAFLFLMFGWPIVTTVAGWVAMLLALPLEAIFTRNP